MIRNAQDIIDDMRNIVKPRIAKMLLEANFEGRGKEDKAEFETEFEMTLTLAEKALEQEPILDKIRYEEETEAIPKNQARLKADMVAMLTEIQLEIEELDLKDSVPDYTRGAENTRDYIANMIEETIDKLKGK